VQGAQGIPSYLPITIAVLSLLVSTAGFVYTRRSKKRELFVELYDKMLEPDRQYGRQLLFEWCEMGTDPSDVSSEDWRKANHAMAWFELVSYMHQKGHIPKKDAFEIWGKTAVRTYKAARQCNFYHLRNDQHGHDLWPHFVAFANDASVLGITGEAPPLRVQQSAPGAPAVPPS
jgi:hypothetical protein